MILFPASATFVHLGFEQSGVVSLGLFCSLLVSKTALHLLTGVRDAHNNLQDRTASHPERERDPLIVAAPSDTGSIFY